MKREAAAFVRSLPTKFDRWAFLHKIPRLLRIEYAPVSRRIADALRILVVGDKFADERLALLEGALDARLRELIEIRQIQVVGAEDPEPRAYVRMWPDQTCVVVLNRGLVDFLYRVARVFATHFVRIEGQEAVRPQRFIEGARIVAEVFWWYDYFGTSGGPDYPIDKIQAKIANSMALAAQCFFLAHELGHVVLHSFNGPPEDEHTEELSADAYAVGILCRAFGVHDSEPDPVLNPIHWLGIELGLLTFAALEELGVDFGTSHPPFSQRLNDLRKEMRGSAYLSERAKGPLDQIGAKCEEVYSEILRAIEGTAEQAASSVWAQQDATAIRGFHELLGRCADFPNGDPINLRADHATFASGMDEFVSAGFARIILSECTRVLQYQMPPGMEIERAEESQVRAHLLSFNKLRVVANWCGSHPLPEIREQYFQEVCRSN